MSFNFRSQTPNVAFLLQVCTGVLANLKGDDKEQLELAVRSFEEVATIAEMTASSVISAANGERLARAEVRGVLDVAAGMLRQASALDVKLADVVQEVIASRTRPETTEVRELAATPGSAWVAIHVRTDGSCQVSAWDGSAKQPFMEGVGSYAEARDRADELSEEIYARRGEVLGATGAVAWVVLPRQGSHSEKTIDPRSGIVAARRGEQVEVYFEGNRLGAENLRLYAQRVTNAAGRLFQRYPTVARAVYSLAEFMAQFEVVGFCTDAYKVEIFDTAAVIAYAGRPGMAMPCGDGVPYLMNERGQWQKGQLTVSRNEVAASRYMPGQTALMHVL